MCGWCSTLACSSFWHILCPRENQARSFQHCPHCWRLTSRRFFRVLTQCVELVTSFALVSYVVAPSVSWFQENPYCFFYSLTIPTMRHVGAVHVFTWILLGSCSSLLLLVLALLTTEDLDCWCCSDASGGGQSQLLSGRPFTMVSVKLSLPQNVWLVVLLCNGSPHQRIVFHVSKSYSTLASHLNQSKTNWDRFCIETVGAGAGHSHFDGVLASHLKVHLFLLTWSFCSCGVSSKKCIFTTEGKKRGL